MKYLFAAAIGLTLAGCAVSGQSYGPDAVAGVEGTYIAGVSAEIAYEKSGAAKPAVVAKAEAARIQAYAALQPLVKAAESGSSVVTAAEFEAANAAIAEYGKLLAANQIKAPGAV